MMAAEEIPIRNAFADDSRYFASQHDTALFRLVPASESGITYDAPYKESFALNGWGFEYSVIGAGVGVADFDGDGLPELFFSGNANPHRLYKNLGDLRFEDVAEAAGVAKNSGFANGVAIADVNADGLPDIYVSRAGPHDEADRRNQLFINYGDLQFKEEAAAYGLALADYSIQATFFDYDRDGDLDLYQSNHPVDFEDKYRPTGNDKVEKGENRSDRLLRNEGNGHFTDVSEAAGIDNHGYGLAVTTGDLNGDGWDDIYVGNDFAMRDYMYINQRDGTFRDEIHGRTQKISHYTMSATITDLDEDGVNDFLTSDLQADSNYHDKTITFLNRQNEYYEALYKKGLHRQVTHNTLQCGNGDGTFSEIAWYAGVAATNWSWAQLAADWDLDGDKDLFVANGLAAEPHADMRDDFRALSQANRKDDKEAFYRIRAGMMRRHYRFPNAFFENTGDLRFADRSRDWAMPMPTISMGACVADLDADGDPDIVTSNINQQMTVYENRAIQQERGHFLRLRLKSSGPNRFAWGSEVVLTTQDGRRQYRRQAPICGYQSTVEDVLHFGLRDATPLQSLEIRWFDGTVETLTEVPVDQTLVLEHDFRRMQDMPRKRLATSPLFEDVTEIIGLRGRHQENFYNDFADQFLLHRKNSHHGPGLAVADIDGDGREDLLMTGAAGFAPQVWLHGAKGRFSPKSSPALSADAAHEDGGALFFDVDGDGDQDLYLSSGGTEFPGDGSGPYRDRLYLNDGQGNWTAAPERLPVIDGSTGCLAAEDFDRDGDLDLFVGGRVVPGRYPEAPRSYLLRNDGGHFTDVTEELAPGLARIGMVTAALWTDYDDDRQRDLLLVGEWMAPTLFRNIRGHLERVESSLFDELHGWWNSLIGLDVDCDGDTDYIAGNMGRNLNYRPGVKTPVELFFHDFDWNGSGDIVLSSYWNGKRYPMPTKDRMMEKVRFIETEDMTYDAYGRSTVRDLFGTHGLDSALHLQAQTFDHILLRNEGQGRFRVEALPDAAQRAPLMGMVVTDFDGDGYPDVLGHGNFHHFEVHTDAQDAGTGFLLHNDGKGGFAYREGPKAGFKSAGDARSLVLLEGADGARLMVAGTNNGPLQALRLPRQPHDVFDFSIAHGTAFVPGTDGYRQKVEHYLGSGYLSQGTSKLHLQKGGLLKLTEFYREGAKP